MAATSAGPEVSWSELLDGARTGDLMLFAGTSWESVLIEGLTSGPYSHASMIVRDSATDTLMLFQSNPTRLADNPSIGPDRHHALPEGLTDGAGVQVGYLYQALNTIDDAGDVAYYRPLDGGRPEAYEQMVHAVMAAQMGKPFGSLTHMAWAYAEGQLGVDAGTDSFFCSQLVAHTYQHSGLLGTEWPANSYAPNDFDADHTIELLMGELGPTRKVDMSTVPGYESAAAVQSTSAASADAAQSFVDVREPLDLADSIDQQTDAGSDAS